LPPFFDAIVMEDGQSDGRPPSPSDTDESNGCEVFRLTNNIFDQFSTAVLGGEILDPLIVQFADLG
jgi:hypothetical protein